MLSATPGNTSWRMPGWLTWLDDRPLWLIDLMAFGLVGLIGIADYLSGVDISLAVIYVFPIALAAWFAGPATAWAVALVSVVVWVAGDYAVGEGWVKSGWMVGIWNSLIRLGFYALLIHLLIYIKELTVNLERTVSRRTADLHKEVAERERLEREMLEVGERERSRLGDDLHDGLCQHLTGTALAAQVLGEKLAAQGAPEAAEASRVVDLIEEGITLSRSLARGLQPMEMRTGGIMQALEEFAAATSDLFQTSCRFECDSPILIANTLVSNHLYCIAQEATGNAIRHGRARNVVIQLDAQEDGLALSVRDDGTGIPAPRPSGDGMGLRIMAKRAKLIGANFGIDSSPGGTVVNCYLPNVLPAKTPHYA